MIRPHMLGSPGLTFNSSVRVTVDGNSIYAGFSTGTIASLLAARSSISGATFVNTAISGQTWADMNTTATDVDTSTATSGVVNILVCAEGTNSVDPAKTGLNAAGVVSAVTTYITARKAANSKLYVLLCSALPRDPNHASAFAMNNALNISDATFLANPAAVGANGYVNMRNIPAFGHNGLVVANYTAYASAWADAPTYIHPSASGVSLMVDRIEAALLAIRANQVQVT